MSNLPPGTTRRDIDNLCRTDNSTPNRHDCILCSREIEQCPDTGWWFFSDEFVYTKPTHFSDFTKAFPTHAGWCCSVDCWDKYALDANEYPDPEESPKLFLVGGAR